jgi:hypothetical protein
MRVSVAADSSFVCGMKCSSSHVKGQFSCFKLQSYKAMNFFSSQNKVCENSWFFNIIFHLS